MITKVAHFFLVGVSQGRIRKPRAIILYVCVVNTRHAGPHLTVADTGSGGERTCTRHTASPEQIRGWYPGHWTPNTVLLPQGNSALPQRTVVKGF